MALQNILNQIVIITFLLLYVGVFCFVFYRGAINTIPVDHHNIIAVRWKPCTNKTISFKMIILLKIKIVKTYLDSAQQHVHELVDWPFSLLLCDALLR